ncbi:hypothetical protein RUND412_009108 [Rhizina undulata]
MSVISLCESQNLGIHVTDLEVEEYERSLLEKHDWEVEVEEVTEEQYLEEDNDNGIWSEASSRDSRRQLMLIYSLHLAEAIVASSLQPQLYMLLRDSQLCGSVNSAYWTGLVETVFALGSIAGIYWGWMSDKIGRRPVALLGMLGLSLSCVVMGFSNGILSCVLVRAFAGLMSSSIRVSTATMIGDISEISSAKARNFSRLPLIATGGVIGPLLQALLAHRFGNTELWKTFPILSSQLACASLMFLIFIINLVLLKETLPNTSSPESLEEEAQPLTASQERRSMSFDFHSEKDFLSQMAERPIAKRYRPILKKDNLEPISFSDIVHAPSLMILLCSYSFFSLHSASFDQLLPLLGNSSTEHGGFGLPCSFLALVVLFASISAGLAIYHGFARSVQRLGLLRLYRLCCWAFPVIYIATPLLSRASRSNEIAIWASSAASIFTKTLVTGLAQTLVVFLVTNASPDAFSLGSIMGFMHSASVFRSLAVAGTGVAFALSEDVGVERMNWALWGIMAAVGIAGAGVAYFVRDHPTVRDYEGSLKWEVWYESTEDLGLGEGGEEL